MCNRGMKIRIDMKNLLQWLGLSNLDAEITSAWPHWRSGDGVYIEFQGDDNRMPLLKGNRDKRFCDVIMHPNADSEIRERVE